MKTPPKISLPTLFIYTHSSTFVRGDISILSKKYSLKEYQFKNRPKFQLPFSLLKLFVYLLFNINKFELIYIWFADYHSFLPSLFAKLFRKRIYIVIGGYDVCREKKYNYGSFSKPLRAYMTLQSIKWASCNLCVSQNIERTVKAIAPKATTTLIYNGVQTSHLKETSPLEEISHLEEPSLSAANGTSLSAANERSLSAANERSLPSSEEFFQRKVLCVALVSTLQAFYIKGIDRYNRVASLLPNVQFVLVGCNPTLFILAGEIPSVNLKIVKAVPPAQLEQYYRTSHLYCQFSRRESFSLSLAEAMSHKMIPVVATTGGMLEVTGGLGYSLYFYECSSNLESSNSIASNYLPNSEIEAAQLIKEALTVDKENSFRERIIQNFTLKIREDLIFKKIGIY